MQIELAYAKSELQILMQLTVDEPCQVIDAIKQSTILQRCPEIDLTRHKVGVWGRVVDLTQPLNDHDRIEIYRPLMLNPKAARRLRAEQQHACRQRGDGDC